MTTTNLKVIEVQKLLPTNYIQRETLFLNQNNEVQAVITAVKNHYSNIVYTGMDGSTEEGRKAIKKVAAELNNVIKDIDNVGKSVTDILKAKPKKIDAGRKVIRDSLSELYATIREPVTKWEEAQAKIKEEAAKKLEEEQRKKDEELEMLRKQVAQQEHDKKVAEETIKTAQLDAIAKLQETEQKLQEATEKTIAPIIEPKSVPFKDVETPVTASTQDDVTYRKMVNTKALIALINLGVEKNVAKNVIRLIIEGKIPNITINY